MFDTAKIMYGMKKQERESIQHSLVHEKSSNDHHQVVTLNPAKISKYALRSSVKSASMTNNTISKRCIKKLKVGNSYLDLHRWEVRRNQWDKKTLTR